jgi:7,8-dihydroneopterin aldolase/epimerase/oxygenase
VDDLDSHDVIKLRGLRVVCIVGVLPEERERAQPLEIDVDLYADLLRAGQSDLLSDTVDYGAVTELVERLCTDTQAKLLERLAHLIAIELAAIEGVLAASVTVQKLRPPVPNDLASSAVRVTRWAE